MMISQPSETHLKVVNRCSCESSRCTYCAQLESYPGTCPNGAEYLVNLYGIKTRLCDACLSSYKRDPEVAKSLSWSSIRDPRQHSPYLRKKPDYQPNWPGRKETPQLDLNPSKGVEIEVSPDGKVLWVNVDGICRLRASKLPYLRIYAPREGVTRLVYPLLPATRAMEKP